MHMKAIFYFSLKKLLLKFVSVCLFLKAESSKQLEEWKALTQSFLWFNALWHFFCAEIYFFYPKAKVLLYPVI